METFPVRFSFVLSAIRTVYKTTGNWGEFTRTEVSVLVVEAAVLARAILVSGNQEWNLHNVS